MTPPPPVFAPPAPPPGTGAAPPAGVAVTAPRGGNKGLSRFEEPSLLADAIVPTPRLAWLLLALVPVVAWLVGNGLGTAALLLDAAVIVIAYFAGKITSPPRGLVIERRMDALLSARVANRVQLRVRNEGEETLSGTLRDEPPPSFGEAGREFTFTLAPGAERTFDYTVTPPERGEGAFAGTFLRLNAPLGLVWRQVHLATESVSEVYPNVLALREFDLLNQQGRLREIGIRKARIRGQGTEFESLRDYADGDDVRRIDWNATARRGKPIVRQYEVERNQLVLLAVDCGRHMLAEVEGVRKLDHVLDAIIMLAHTAAQAGDQVGVLAYSAGTVAFIPPMKGRGAIGVVLHALHDLVAEPVQTDAVAAFSYLGARVKRRALLMNFTSLSDAGRAREVVRGLSPLVRRHLVLTVDVSDPKLKELRDRPIQTADDLSKVAAAQWVERDRREATGIAQAAGLRTLEAEPQDLAAALVNAYLDVKGRALL